MNFYKSFSGTDTLAFIMMPGCTPVVIGSLTTISYSMFRNKKPVINIGRTNINGVTRGSRIFAGTMIFTLINQHWLRDLQEQDSVSYLKNFKELKVDELPLFDIMIVSANEYGSVVSMYIFGIDFTDEAQTISVEDLFTENTFSFVARDVSTFEKFNTTKNSATGSSHYIDGDIYGASNERIYRLASSQTSVEEIAQRVQEQTLLRNEAIAKLQAPVLPRDLYLNTSHIMIGNDVMEVQTLLFNLYPEIDINGMFDEQTDKYVRLFQSDYKLPSIDGVVNDRVYSALCDIENIAASKYKLGIVVNKNGTFCYEAPTLNSNVNQTLKYKEKIELISMFEDDRDGYSQKWYQTPYGYVISEDVYSSYEEHQIVEFPTIKYQDTSVYVTMVQSALAEVYPDVQKNGVYDSDTVNKVKSLQQQYGLYPSGNVDNETWLLLQSLTGTIHPEDNSFMFMYNVAPGSYTITTADSITKQLSQYYCTISCNNPVTTKSSVIAKYPNGNTKTFSIDKTGTEYNAGISELQKALVYNPSEGSIPTTLEWIVYPLNKTPYKWTFNIA